MMVFCCSCRYCSFLLVLFVIMDKSYSMCSDHCQKPVFGEPFTLFCPLKASDSAKYQWTKYRSLDRQIKLPFPNDVTFTSNSQQWSVDWYTSHHNGLYECHASNLPENGSYVDDTLFYFHTEQSCLNTVPNTSITRLSTGSLTTTLNCEMNSGIDLNLVPYWYILRNNTKQLCVPPSFSVQRPQYHHSTCTWTIALTLNVSSSETVFCGSGCVWANYSIRVGRDDSIVTTSLTTCSVIMVCLLFTVGVMYNCYNFSKPDKKSTEPSLSGFEYDVYLCAHDELRSWTEQMILLPLELCDPPYKVCWHLRDFVAGLPVNEQIVNAIFSSRKVVIVFSKHFMSSKFCLLELEHALYRQVESGTRCLLPIAMKDNLVPPEVRRRLTYMILMDNKEKLVSRLTQLLGPSISSRTFETTLF